MIDEQELPVLPAVHPAADIFTILPKNELDELADDIRQWGQRDPCVMHNGMLLDGRNRWLACSLVGVEPRMEEWDGQGGSPTAFVISVNLKRRHLNESQRAMCAARAMPLFEEEARERQRDGWKIRDDLMANLPEGVEGTSRAKAAEPFHVSPRSVENASTVVHKGTPELAKAVDSGNVAVSTAALIASLPREKQREILSHCDKREIVARSKEIRAEKSNDRRRERMEQLADISRGNSPLLAPDSFPILYADPPWRYDYTETETRAIENQYPTMTVQEICDLDVASVCTDDCVLFLWATSPKLADAMRVLDAWGFGYKTCAVWIKDKIGMGYYFRQQHELLLVATRGNPPSPAPADRPSSVIEAERAEHSSKPYIVYTLIEQMYPGLPKMEMFCREPRKGWFVWGNQSK